VTSRFEIKFEGDPWTDEDGLWRNLRITLQNFVETDCADFSSWSTRDYEAQWLTELNAISTSRDRGGLITSIHDPSDAYRVWIWPMWKEGENVYFQSRLLFMLEPEPRFDPSRVGDYVGDHQLISEDGEPLSQWIVSLTSIRDFLDRKNESGETCSTPS
jgi:hypothetical protein